MSWEMRGEGWVNYWNTETSSPSRSHVCMPHTQYPLGFFRLPQIFGSGILWWKLIGIFTSSMNGMMGWSIIQNFEVGEIVSRDTVSMPPPAEPWLMHINSGVDGWSVRIAQIFGPYDQYIWSNCSDLTRPQPKWCFSKGNPLISWKPRLVKYYLARICIYIYLHLYMIYDICAWVVFKGENVCIGRAAIHTIMHPLSSQRTLPGQGDPLELPPTVRVRTRIIPFLV